MKIISKKFFSINRIDLISKFFDINRSFILEIGIHRGVFSKELITNFNPKKIVLVDPWVAFDDSKYDDSFYGNKLKNGQSLQDQYYYEVVRNFDNEIKNHQVEIVRDTSDNFFKKNIIEFDLIYIDGNHIYEFVKNDIFNSLKSLKQDGIIVLDDYKLKGWWKDGVTKAVNYYHTNNKVNLLAKHNFFNYHHQCILSKI